MGEIEQKLDLEKQITDLRREHKSYAALMETVKAEYHAVVEAKEKTEKLLGDQRELLKEVLDDISNAKLKWTLEKDSQLKAIEDKVSEANNVLKRKAELNEQEERIRQIEAADTEIRNEARRLELKNQEERDNLNAEKKILENIEKELEEAKTKLESDKQEFKDRVLKVIKTVDKL